MTWWRIIPDAGLDNRRVEELIRTIAAWWVPLFEGNPIFSFETMLEKDGAAYYIGCPREHDEEARKQIEMVWSGVTLEDVKPPAEGRTAAQAARLELKDHYMFSLKVDRRVAGAVSSILEAGRMLDEGQWALCQVLMKPAPPDWYEGAAEAYEKFTQGKMPQRIRFDGKTVVQGTAKVAAYTLLEVTSMIEELLTGETPKTVDLSRSDRVKALRENPKNAERVAGKLRREAVDVTVRIATNGPGHILRTLWNAFRSLDGDNGFVMKTEKPDRIHTRKPPVKVNLDYLGTAEAGRLVCLPTSTIQEEFNLKAKRIREVDLPESICNGGLKLGTVEHRGRRRTVYLPTENLDELCLPHVVTGGMGVGKTTQAINVAHQTTLAGYTAVVFDPAKGEIGDALERIIPDRVDRYRFGDDVVGVDWVEAPGGNHVANELLSFFEEEEEAGFQTARYLRGAARVSENLLDVGRIFTDKDFREKRLPMMSPYDRQTWEQFGELTAQRQAQIAAPIWNRLDTILGDDYLRRCMESDRKLNFINDLKPGRVIVLDIPARKLTAPVANILGAILNSKLNLAMLNRRTDHPVMVIQDEPHQFLKGSRTWKTVAVESRKWRFSYWWLFHYFHQLPVDVRSAIQAAGAHYHIYRSEKGTVKALAEEIAPFTVEDVLKLERGQAVNVIRTEGGTTKPFVARMNRITHKRGTSWNITN